MHLVCIRDLILFLFLYDSLTEFFSYFPSEVPQFRVISWANLTIQVSSFLSFLCFPRSFTRPDNAKVALLYFLYLFFLAFSSLSVWVSFQCYVRNLFIPKAYITMRL